MGLGPIQPGAGAAPRYQRPHEEFNAWAGQRIAQGMTSRDPTGERGAPQIRRSLEVIFAHGVAAVARLAERAVS